MIRNHRLRLSALSLGLLAALAVAPASAQSTSAGIGGQVVGSSGQPVAGAEVTIVHVESGTVSRATTDASGRYTARGLRVGGPYEVTITKSGEGTRTEDNIYLALNQVSTVNTILTGDMTTLGTVSVVGVAGGSYVFSSDNTGVGTSIGGRQLELLPTGSRSIDDVARLDPRISVIDQGSGAISVAGINNRFNTISVDGLSQGDPFGLNSNGMPYTGSPISMDTIEAFDINISDYDVSTDTIGATVNAVTKSGTNQFHGSVYYVYKDSKDLVGSRDGQDYALFDTDVTKGITFGGPILRDRLFFFGSYEEQTIKDFGGASSTDAFARGAITQDEIDQVIAIARNYGIDPGTYGNLGVNLENKRYLAKIDWNISDNHRASLTYQQTEEFRPSPYDITTNSVSLSSRWYNIDNVTKNTSLQLFSDWTTNFSTEFKASYQKFDQENGNAFNEGPSINVGTANIVATGATTGIGIGEDRNRHENRINTEIFTASLIGTYYAGNHTIKGGLDYRHHDVLNLYGRDLHGVYWFSSIEDFAAGTYAGYSVRRPVGDFTEADTAAALVYEEFSPFLQDTWQATDNLTMTFGVRVNIPKVDQAPTRHPTFESAFGFPNDYQLGSDNKVILPRFSFNYQFDGERYSQLRGGLGLFQSIPPFVWLANPYQNNGVTAALFTLSSYNPAYPFSPDPYNQPAPDDLAVSGAAQVDVIDPDFKLPTMWKLSLGYDTELPWWGLIATAEVQHLRDKDAIFYQAINIGESQGTLFDGRQSYWCALGGGTGNANKNCGLDPAFAYNSTMLGNTDKGSSTAVTFALSKPLTENWFGSLSYTYTKAKEVGSDGSSTAWSSYQYVSRLDPNEEIATTAGREVRDSIKATLGWDKALFGDYRTSVGLFYSGRSGVPYTWTFNGDANGDRIFQDPAYIPLVDDPNVSYGNATAAQIAAFHEFISSDSYLQSARGGVAERHATRYPWINTFDVSFQQELPGFFSGHKSVLRLDIYNFGNLLNKDWGQTYGGTFSDNTRQLVTLASVNADGTYTYNLGTPESPTWQDNVVYDASNAYPSRVVSRWSAMLTLRYQF